MNYFARFENIDGDLFRFDTRIYLNGFDPERESVCVGAMVGKNPGSATPKVLGELAPLELNRDKMLPVVRNRFNEAYRLAGKPLPLNAFVRVWNLFYICDPVLDSAIEKAAKFQVLPLCSTENEVVPVIWYGWGGDDQGILSFKERFLDRGSNVQFFYDHRRKEVIAQKPTAGFFARHTQGMPKKPIIEHLITIVQS